MHNHLPHTLDVVGELSRVALENVCVQSEVSTQATGRGDRGGGSTGRGGVRGRSDCRGPALVPVRCCEDEDELSNFHCAKLYVY